MIIGKLRWRTFRGRFRRNKSSYKLHASLLCRFYINNPCVINAKEIAVINLFSFKEKLYIGKICIFLKIVVIRDIITKILRQVFERNRFKSTEITSIEKVVIEFEVMKIKTHRHWWEIYYISKWFMFVYHIYAKRLSKHHCDCYLSLIASCSIDKNLGCSSCLFNSLCNTAHEVD